MRSVKFDTSETPKTSRNLRAVLNKSLLRNISVYGYVSVTKKEQIRLLSAGSWSFTLDSKIIWRTKTSHSGILQAKSKKVIHMYKLCIWITYVIMRVLLPGRN